MIAAPERAVHTIGCGDGGAGMCDPEISADAVALPEGIAGKR
jgi:hypothetical protein